MTDIPKVMTATEVAELIGVNVQTVYRLAQRGEIPHFKVGTCTRFSQPKIVAWINGQM